MAEVYLFGHKNPDTDSICSSIAYEELKNQISSGRHVACRLGELNNETAWVLDRFHTPAPPLIHDVYPQIRDTQYYPFTALSKDDTIRKSWDLMKGQGLSLAPVVDKGGRMAGIVSTQDITEAYMDLVEPDFLSAYQITVGKIAETLHAQVICGQPAERDIPARFFLYSHASQSIAAKDLLLANDDMDFITGCLDSPARYLIISGRFSYDDMEAIRRLGELRGKVVLYTPESAFAVTRLIAQAIPVCNVMKSKDIVAFQPNNTIDDVMEVMLQQRHRYFPVVDLNYRPLGLISRQHLITYKRKQVILMDHNEKHQTVDGIDEAEILEILDHHRLGDIQTGRPLFVNCKAVGATCTIVAEQYFLHGITPRPEIAGLMLSAIISDTLLFRSPTCTDTDKETARKLAELCEVDIYEYGQEMLKSGASLMGLTPEKILKNDAKQYEIGKYKIHTCQILTTDLDQLLAQAAKIEAEALALCKKNGYDGVVLMVTDFIRYGSELMVFGDEREALASALGFEGRQREFLDGVVSRKSQVFPKLVLNLQK